MTEKTETKIEKIRARIAQDEARLAALVQQQKKAERSRDTRRKVLAGAVILNAVAKDEKLRNLFRNLLNDGLSAPRDRELFPEFLPVASGGGQTSGTAHAPTTPETVSGADVFGAGSAMPERAEAV